MNRKNLLNRDITKISISINDLLNQFYNDIKFSDLVVKTKFRKWFLHRIIVSASCEFLEKYSTSNFDDKIIIDLSELESSALSLIFEYCYTGKLEINQHNVEKLLIHAHFLKCKSIVSECSNFLIRQLNIENENPVYEIYKISKRLKLNDLSKATELFINLNFCSLMNTDFSKDLEFNALRSLIESGRLYVENVSQILDAVRKWTGHFYFRTVYDICLTLLIYQKYSQININNQNKNILIVLSDSDLMEKDQMKISSIYQENTQYPRFFIKLIEKKSNFSAAIINSKIFVAGGFCSSCISYSFHCFDFYTKSWNKLENSITGGALSLSVFENSLYAAGGNEFSQEVESTNYFSNYNISTGKWIKLPQMSSERSNFCSVILDKSLFAIGGRNKKDALKKVEKYSFKLKKWERCPEMNCERFNFGASVYGNKIVVVGGYNQNFYLSEIEIFDNNSWSIISRIHKPREMLSICVLDDKLLILGGLKNKKMVTEVEILSDKNEVTLDKEIVLPPNSSLSVIKISKELISFKSY